MLDQLFGDLSVPVRFAIAFGVVLSLIAITFVALRRFAGRKLPLGNGGRARQPRLGVLDAFAIDARRRLVLIRRDNVEHLIMIGGPNDVLIESEIVRAPAQAALPAQTARRAPGEATRAAVAAPSPRALPSPDQPAPATPPPAETTPRPAAFRNAFQRPPADSATTPRSTPSFNPLRAAQRTPQPEPAAPERDEGAPVAPPTAPAAPAARPPKADIDPLYADIERKLGEALSRAPSQPANPPPPAPQRSAPPPFARTTPAARPATPPPQAAQRPAPPPPPPAAPKEPAKNHLDALEEEMASLLGRDRPS